jgi:hypothetical protein
MGMPVLAFHSRTVLSLLPDATNRTSALKATLVTHSV